MSSSRRPAGVCRLAAALSLCAVSLVAAPTPAHAAALTEVTGFGANPTGLRMFLYVPDTVAVRPAVVVALHFCTGSGPVFFQNTEFRTLADQLGFIVVYPSATRSGSCFDVSTPPALTHNGSSDPAGIVSMVRWVLQNRGGDAGRVYVTGASSGAMMTNVLLGDYPDVFKAGAAFMGVPFACFATTDGSMWNSTCANGMSIKTPQQWGDLARGAFPGFAGARPRMQVWHGTQDTTLRFPNFGEEIKQWTNVLGVSQTPAFTDQPQSTWTRTRYGGTGTSAPVEAIRVEGAGHSLPTTGMARMAIQFFGLTTPPSPSPMPTPTPTPTPAPTPSPTPTPGGGSCRVTYAVNAWNNGFTTAITITNDGSAPVNGWALTFTLPAGQVITSGWGASYAPPSGAVSARNAPYNPTILAHSTLSGIGFQATHTGNTNPPASFALNGVPCSGP